MRLYATFANGGFSQELNFTSNPNLTKNQPKALLDPASCYIISDILSGIQRPDFPNNFDFTFRLPKIAWKTGTSFGKRDAWAIGYNPDYTVGRKSQRTQVLIIFSKNGNFSINLTKA